MYLQEGAALSPRQHRPPSPNRSCCFGTELVARLLPGAAKVTPARSPPARRPPACPRCWCRGWEALGKRLWGCQKQDSTWDLQAVPPSPESQAWEVCPGCCPWHVGLRQPQQGTDPGRGAPGLPCGDRSISQPDISKEPLSSRSPQPHIHQSSEPNRSDEPGLSLISPSALVAALISASAAQADPQIGEITTARLPASSSPRSARPSAFPAPGTTTGPPAGAPPADPHGAGQAPRRCLPEEGALRDKAQGEERRKPSPPRPKSNLALKHAAGCFGRALFVLSLAERQLNFHKMRGARPLCGDLLGWEGDGAGGAGLPPSQAGHLGGTPARTHPQGHFVGSKVQP